VVEKALEKQPSDRYQSMRELVIDLHRLTRHNVETPGRAMHLTRGAVERIASIAVLPFADMSAAMDQDWFCDGIAEEILNALTALKGLKVAARPRRFRSRARATIFGPSARSST